MCVLNFLKAMDAKHCDDATVIYRTTPTVSVLGGLFLLAGVGIIARLFFPGCSVSSLFTFCMFCLFIAMFFILIGLVLLSYRRVVTIDKVNYKIEVVDSNITGCHESAIHFEDISALEIAMDSECIFGEESGLWMVRVYVCKLSCDGDRRLCKVEKLITTADFHEVREVADYFARLGNVEIVNSYVAKRTGFSTLTV